MTRQQVTPMIHVTDVRATVAWHESLGFVVLNTNEATDEGMNFALLAYGNSQVMFNAGGRLSSDDRRDVDLYVRIDDVDSFHERLKDRVQIRVGLNETFYGAREFIVRDLIGFWLTFGQDLGSTNHSDQAVIAQDPNCPGLMCAGASRIRPTTRRAVPTLNSMEDGRGDSARRLRCS